MISTPERTRDLAEVRHAINNLDLLPLRLKLTTSPEGPGWTEAKALQVEAEYRTFLFLLYAHPDQPIVPSDDIDEYWHAHILDTRKYAADCERAFGHFVHHWPYFGLEESQREAFWAAFHSTQLLMKEAAQYFSTSTSPEPRQGAVKARGCVCKPQS